MNNINISRKDVIWNYTATFLQISSSVLLLPFILRTFPQETVAIWTIFSTVILLTGLLDFGFNPSFARNVSYVISGAKSLKKSGYDIVENHNEVDYSLLKGLIKAMRWFYSRMALILFVFLVTVGTYYITFILNSYSGNKQEVFISWFILCIINSYSLYTLYYDSLMVGKGLVMKNKQISIIGQVIYLAVAIILIFLKFNLIAIVSAQALSVLIRRFLSHKAIYTFTFKTQLQNAKTQSEKHILAQIYPNAIKVGLANIGGFLVSRSSIIIGSFFIPLTTIASFGITIQIINIIASISRVYFLSYQPKMVQMWIQNSLQQVKNLYIKSSLCLFLTFIICGFLLIFLGDWALSLLGSQTPLLSKAFIAATLLIFYLESNHSLAGTLLLTKNEVPFFKASLISGGIILTMLIVSLKFFHMGVWAMILIPGIVQLVYQNWRWPLEVLKELKIKKQDIIKNLISIKTLFQNS